MSRTVDDDSCHVLKFTVLPPAVQSELHVFFWWALEMLTSLDFTGSKLPNNLLAGQKFSFECACKRKNGNTCTVQLCLRRFLLINA